MPVSPLKLSLMLAPALAVIVGLFGGGFGLAVLQSFGYLPLVGSPTPSWAAYRAVFSSPGFLAALGLSLYLALVSTAIAAGLALLLALALRETQRGRAVLTFLLQLNLPIPHLVGAIAMVQLLGQSGSLARVAVNLDLIRDPSQFPVLIFDRAGVAIIVEYVWKELPFIAVALLAQLRTIGPEYEQVAQILGANPWQRFRLVLLPLLLPGLLSSSVLVFAYAFSAFEVPLLLGSSFPQALAVLAYKAYTDVDLAARPQAMALSVIITLISTALTFAYLQSSRRMRG